LEQDQPAARSEHPVALVDEPVGGVAVEVLDEVRGEDDVEPAVVELRQVGAVADHRGDAGTCGALDGDVGVQRQHLSGSDLVREVAPAGTQLEDPRVGRDPAGQVGRHVLPHLGPVGVVGEAGSEVPRSRRVGAGLVGLHGHSSQRTSGALGH
jgi:hypothetical protein